MTQLDKMDFATLTEEELKILQQAEDQINSTRDEWPRISYGIGPMRKAR
ncbi:MAG: hypothetical protein ACOX6S_14185 [Clostridia bacterium]